MKKIYLFNPINGLKTETNYNLLEGITGKNKNNLACFKCKKMKIVCINSYIVDDSFTKKELYELMLKEKIKNEIWKDIKNTKNRYQISNYGRVRKIENNKILLIKPYVKRKKFMIVKIDKKEKPVHKLVADAFLEQPPGTKIYHKNNKFDNYTGNLGFCTSKEIGTKFAGLANAIPVIKLDPNTLKEIERYESMSEAGRRNYIDSGGISEHIKGKQKTAGGFKWKIDIEFIKCKDTI